MYVLKAKKANACIDVKSHGPYKEYRQSSVEIRIGYRKNVKWYHFISAVSSAVETSAERETGFHIRPDAHSMV